MKNILNIAALALCLFMITGLLPAQAAAAGSYTAKVYADSLNVRSEPAKDAPVKGSIKSGELVTVTDEQHGWAKINSRTTTGWVAGYYLKPVSGSAKTSGAAASSSSTTVVKVSSAGGGTAKATVAAGSLRIRGGPGTSYAVLGSLQAADKVTVLRHQSGWAKIRTASGETGWVAAQYLNSGSSSGSSVKSSAKSTGGLRGKLIVLDPGHGGSDPGMLGTTYNTMEKDLNLQTAFYVRDYLQAAGARVDMTRTGDQKPSLSRRVQVSESLGADAFVSIHYNSSPKRVSGILTFFYSEGKDMRLARAIETRLGQGIGLRSNGISFGDYHILRENQTPSTLVELGFLSNPHDESVVRKRAYQRKAARAIADGLADYFSR
ncbi:N-acetylmuramoyl-L-alanine amidase [Paenibacillus albidus]|uniref:N-acetylmuramoyl-L-alanine amidase n=1 Tax=Paenibacillus albidus TaxID=2041023 RepID=UPI001BEBFA7B|nr:N-acetylmuramoyl-L-alanine amidase [Paenibacillus albidus]MBT2291092.1 N-acetylmuramoyl-L-alanine amidase [Paenibacillus albidus]